ncbi:MAG: glutamate racemase [Paucibacter sp.]|nr:glutamate racemase [Roseateles sp.]
MFDPQPCIGVFDSGVGGLTVLRELRQQLSEARLLYLADAAHAPYGEKTPDFIVQRSLAIGSWLKEQGASLLVVACNTATAHAIHALRERWPDLPVVGTEPGIKPAVQASRNGRVGVLATPATLASARYRSLIERHGASAQVISQPCAGLVDAIEQGELHAPALRRLVQEFCAPLREAGVDTVLMGCTHYPLVRPLIQEALGPDVRLLDVETAVAQQACRLWTGPTTECAPGLRIATTGVPMALQRFVSTALGWRDVPVESASV